MRQEVLAQNTSITETLTRRYRTKKQKRENEQKIKGDIRTIRRNKQVKITNWENVNEDQQEKIMDKEMLLTVTIYYITCVDCRGRPNLTA